MLHDEEQEATQGNMMAQRYVPGQPGAPWTDEEALTVKAKLWRLFAVGESKALYDKIAPGNDKVGWQDAFRPASKMMRLGFHDCLKYTDGTGGCDGCLDYQGVGGRYNESEVEAAGKFFYPKKGFLSHNNGFQVTVGLLEAVYTDRNFPEKTPQLPYSLRDSGKSRADLWAFAAICGVEYGITINNAVCEDPEYEHKYYDGGMDVNGGRHCHHLQGQDGCTLTLERSIQFRTGRKDCGDNYTATKKEVPPDDQASGHTTAAFFQDNFGFTGQDTVAIMGAHTMGRFHYPFSMFRYVWVHNGGMMFNNQYYRNIVGGKGDFRTTGECVKVGDAWGEPPAIRWMVHGREDTEVGGPFHWIQEKHICPEECSDPEIESEDPCCQDIPAGANCVPDNNRPKGSDSIGADDDVNSGCERYRFAMGLDQMTLPAEIGLYLNFSSDPETGIPYGCPGFEDFNLDKFHQSHKYTWTRRDSEKADPVCEKNDMQVGGSKPLYQIMEDYATDQQKWANDFVVAFEKMQANGYELSELVDGPDRWDGVTCPAQDHLPTAQKYWSCFREGDTEDAGPTVYIQSRLDDRVMQVNEGHGQLEMWTKIEGAESQQWRWMPSGDQLRNVGSKSLLTIKGVGNWAIEPATKGDPDDKIITGVDANGNAVAIDRGWSQEDGKSVNVWRVHSGKNQRWHIVDV